MIAHRSDKVIADGEISLRECTIAELLAESEQLLELLADGDHARLTGSAIRRATTVNELAEVSR